MENIRRNATLWKEKSGVKLCAVVKADAYGHGAEEVTLALAETADMFAVALIEEGQAIRTAACGRDILVFTPPLNEEECYALLSNGFLVSVPNLFTARLLVKVSEKYNLPARVHLKVNTGMNRYGMNPSMLGRVCHFLQDKPWISVEGLYSHLYTCERGISEWQRREFLQMREICKRYFPSFISHLGATYGCLLGKSFSFDMVRIGLGLYGYTPVPTTLPLEKGMTVETRVVLSRKYAKGGVGYGELPKERTPKRLALCRVGYADGILRQSKNGTDGWEENINPACMDVSIRESDKRRGASVPVMTNADETAKITGTVSYEVLCAATRRAERLYIK